MSSGQRISNAALERGLLAALEAPDTFVAFRAFAKRQQCAENLSFWLEVERFRRFYKSPAASASQNSGSTTKQPHSEKGGGANNSSDATALHIYLKYFTPDSPFELNLTQRERESVERALAAKSRRSTPTAASAPAEAENATSRGDKTQTQFVVHHNNGADSTDVQISAVPISAFDEAQASIFSMMALDTFPAFVQYTREHDDALNDLTRRSDPGDALPEGKRTQNELLDRMDHGSFGHTFLKFDRSADTANATAAAGPQPSPGVGEKPNISAVPSHPQLQRAMRDAPLSRSASARFKGFVFGDKKKPGKHDPSGGVGIDAESFQQQLKHESQAIALEHVRDLENTPLAIHVCAQLEPGRLIWKMVEVERRRNVSDFTATTVSKLHGVKDEDPAAFGVVLATPSGQVFGVSGKVLPTGVNVAAAVAFGDAVFLDPNERISAVNINPEKHSLVLVRRGAGGAGQAGRTLVRIRLKKKSFSLSVDLSSDTPDSLLDYLTSRESVKRREGLYLVLRSAKKEIPGEVSFLKSCGSVEAGTLFLVQRRSKKELQKQQSEKQLRAQEIATRMRRATLNVSADSSHSPVVSVCLAGTPQSNRSTPPVLRRRSSTSPELRYFGQPLRNLMMQQQQQTSVPWLLEETIGFLLLNTGQVSKAGAALFAPPSSVPGADGSASGRGKVFDELEYKINHGERPDLSALDSVTLAAGLLVEFLTQLPEPLLTFTLWDRLAAVADVLLASRQEKVDGGFAEANSSEARLAISECLAELPTQNASIVAMLLDFFHSCTTNATMSASEIALLFGEQFLCPAPDDFVVAERARYGVVAEVVLQELVRRPHLVTGGKSDEVAAFLHKVVVLWDYDAENGEELTLKAGDVLGVIVEDDSGWWRGRVLGDASNENVGLFPVSYVQVIEAEEEEDAGGSFFFSQRQDTEDHFGIERPRGELVLAEMFPELDKDRVDQMMAQADGDIDAVIDQLLDAGFGFSQASSASPLLSAHKKPGSFRRPPPLLSQKNQEAGGAVVKPPDRSGAARYPVNPEYENVPDIDPAKFEQIRKEARLQKKEEFAAIPDISSLVAAQKKLEQAGLAQDRKQQGSALIPPPASNIRERSPSPTHAETIPDLSVGPNTRPGGVSPGSTLRSSGKAGQGGIRSSRDDAIVYETLPEAVPNDGKRPIYHTFDAEPPEASTASELPRKKTPVSDTFLRVVEITEKSPAASVLRVGDEISVLGSLTRAMLAREPGVLGDSKALMRKVGALLNRCEGSMISVLVLRGSEKQRVMIRPARSPTERWKGYLGCRLVAILCETEVANDGQSEVPVPDISEDDLSRALASPDMPTRQPPLEPSVSPDDRVFAAAAATRVAADQFLQIAAEEGLPPSLLALVDAAEALIAEYDRTYSS